jgi:hypothetical protein
MRQSAHAWKVLPIQPETIPGSQIVSAVWLDNAAIRVDDMISVVKKRLPFFCTVQEGVNLRKSTKSPLRKPSFQ